MKLNGLGSRLTKQKRPTQLQRSHYKLQAGKMNMPSLMSQQANAYEPSRKSAPVDMHVPTFNLLRLDSSLGITLLSMASSNSNAVLQPLIDLKSTTLRSLAKHNTRFRSMLVRRETVAIWVTKRGESSGCISQFVCRNGCARRCATKPVRKNATI
jgi:hypothetical protein